jgi:hypothetical protein
MRSPERNCSNVGAVGLAASPRTGLSAISASKSIISVGTYGRLQYLCPSGPDLEGSDVDLYQLSMGPLDCIRGRHALDGFGVHVDEDVFEDRFRRGPA